MVAALDLHVAVRADGAMFVSLQHADAVAAHDFFALAVYLQAAVMLDVLFEVTLRMQVNQLLVFAVFDAQLVVTVAAGGTAAAKHALGLVGR